MFEKIIFNVLAFTLFILIFFKLIRKNDTSYVYLLAIQFIGIEPKLINGILVWVNRASIKLEKPGVY